MIDVKFGKKHPYSKEPIIHSHITDCLPDDDERAWDSINCEKCGEALHSIPNECMQTWIETEFGNYCTTCFKFTTVMDYLESNIK